MFTDRKEKVSLCMIVRDEERHLEDCLTPVAKLFDEIVVVDTGSRDRTRDIAARFTPKVLDFAWCDSFAAARNESLRHATGEWIFWLDADDRLSPDNSAKLQALLATLDDQPQVFMMSTVSRSWQTADDPWAVDHPRLFRRHEGLCWKGRVHEQLCPEPRELGYRVVSSEVQIDHLGYQDAGQCFRKRQQKLRLLRMDYAENPDEPSTLYHLALVYASSGKLDLARQHLERIVQLQNPLEDYMPCVCCAWARVTASAGQTARSLQIIDQALARFPQDEQLLYVKAQILFEQEQYEAAGNLALQIRQGNLFRRSGNGPADIQRRLAPRMHGAALRMQGRLNEAAAALRSVVQEHPSDTATWYHLGMAYLDAEDRRQLEDVLHSLRDCPEGEFTARFLLAMWYLRHGQLEQAEALVDQLIVDGPQSPFPRMLQAELLSRRGAPWQSQAQVVREILRIQPTNREAKRWQKILDDSQRMSWSAVTQCDGSSIIVTPGVATAESRQNNLTIFSEYGLSRGCRMQP